MRAIDPDPAKRWQEPKELGKALAAYMQRNSINDTPITIYTPIEAKPEDVVPVQPRPFPTKRLPARRKPSRRIRRTKPSRSLRTRPAFCPIRCLTKFPRSWTRPTP